MRRLLVCSVLVGGGVGLYGVEGAQAAVECTPLEVPVAGCATVSEDGLDARVSSATSPGGAAGVSATADGVTVWGDGNEANGEPASGWVTASVSEAGPDVDCGASGSPDATGCSPG